MATLTLFLPFLSLLLISSVTVSCRVLSSEFLNNSILISDGVHDHTDHEFLTLEPLKNGSKPECVHVYGFLPCADNVEGYFFQVFSFGCLLIVGDYFLSQGRKKLFMVFEVGFYGGIVFPLLTMFPRIALMLSSGLSLTRDVAYTFIGQNIGVTVGYTVFALTMQWGACVVFGMTAPISDQPVTTGEICDSTMQKEEVRKMKILKSLAEASVEADPNNKKTAGIMLLSLLPFVMVTLSSMFDSQSSLSYFIVLITMIGSSCATIVYFVYSFFDTPNQEKSLEHARFEIMSEIHNHLHKFSPENLIKEGEISTENLQRLFHQIDTNNDQHIQISELKNFTLEFGNLGTMKYEINDIAKTFFAAYDEDKDGVLNAKEFEKGTRDFLNQGNPNFDTESNQTENQIDTESNQTENQIDTESNQTENQTEIIKVVIPKKTLAQKLLSMKTLSGVIEVTLGILIVIFLAKPFMMNLELLSVSAGVPSFYVIFAVIPLARNLKNALSARFCRPKDKAKISSDTFSEIYKDVTMNNLMGISIILAIVYSKGLTWNYSTESLIVVVVGVVIGVPAYVRKTYPFWICVLAFALYLLSLLVVYLHFSLAT